METTEQTLPRGGREHEVPNWNRLRPVRKGDVPTGTHRTLAQEELMETMESPGWNHFIRLLCVEAKEYHRDLVTGAYETQLSAVAKVGALKAFTKVLSEVYKAVGLELPEFLKAVLQGDFS